MANFSGNLHTPGLIWFRILESTSDDTSILNYYFFYITIVITNYIIGKNESEKSRKEFLKSLHELRSFLVFDTSPFFALMKVCTHAGMDSTSLCKALQSNLDRIQPECRLNIRLDMRKIRAFVQIETYK